MVRRNLGGKDKVIPIIRELVARLAQSAVHFVKIELLTVVIGDQRATRAEQFLAGLDAFIGKAERRRGTHGSKLGV